MFDFTGQTVVITGAGSPNGMGRVFAADFARLGARVILVDEDQNGIDINVDELRHAGFKADGYAADITDPAAVKRLTADIAAAEGRIDVLVNNAGITQKLTVADMTMDDIQRMFSVNVYGLFLLTREVCEVMKEQNYGRIVHISSVAAKRGGGLFGGAHYSASKAAVLGFSKNLAREVSPYGVTTNCVAAGLINTHVWKGMPDEDKQKILEQIPMGRPGEPEEISAAVVFLASREASYITGEEIDVNGGSHMD